MADLSPGGSRRLTGPNLFLDGFGAVLEAPLPDGDESFIEAWETEVRNLWRQLEWPEPQTRVRRYPGFATLAVEAPEDVLYTACEANETAWAGVVAGSGVAPPDHLSVGTLTERSLAERDPRRLAIAARAAEHGVRFFADDELLSVGSGTGSQVWPVTGLPDPDTISWNEIHDIPVALVTGTNGKTTTVRMLARIAATAGLTAGNTSTDGVQLGGQTILEGDYTGGEGARALMRDRRVEIAFLEVARGGMLRRGLPLEHADVSYVANIGTDHLGEYGIDTLEQLAEVKLLVAKVVAEQGVLVGNGDDVHVAPALARQASRAILVDPASMPEGHAYVRSRGRLGPVSEGRFVPWLEQAEVPATLGGAAVHNIYNALGAMAVATELGIARRPVTDGLAGFTSDPESNPGRCNVFNFGDARAIVDYAHNPEGLSLVLAMVEAMRPNRFLVVIGQAGDRDPDSINALADICAQAAPDRVVVKTMEAYGRGRDPHEVAAQLRDRLLHAGLASDIVVTAPDEMTAARQALEWAAPGDVLLLLSHAARADLLAFLGDLDARGWRPSTPIPSTTGEAR